MKNKRLEDQRKLRMRIASFVHCAEKTEDENPESKIIVEEIIPKPKRKNYTGKRLKKLDSRCKKSITTLSLKKAEVHQKLSEIKIICLEKYKNTIDEFLEQKETERLLAIETKNYDFARRLNRRLYLLVHENGTEELTENLQEWCANNELHYQTLSSISTSNRYRWFKGWFCVQLA